MDTLWEKQATHQIINNTEKVPQRAGYADGEKG